MGGLPGCSTSEPSIGRGVSLSRLCFQPVTDKRDGAQGAVCVCVRACAKSELGEIKQGKLKENGTDIIYGVCATGPGQE